MKDYNSLSKKELIQIIEKLESRKKYGLIWDEEKVPEKVVVDCKDNLPVLSEVKNKEIITDESLPTNILIEGDNYHALSVLNYTHKGKIDLIYIDPPYNTGAKDWKYNNDYVDKNDSWRHSKWISMMEKRLLLAKSLLRESGVMMVAIDDHEVHNLRHLLNNIMIESNYIATICIEVNPAGQNIRENSPAISHDYCLIYAKNIDNAIMLERPLSDDEIKAFKESDLNGNFIWDNLRRRGGNSTPKDRPGQWYPLYCNPDSNEISLNKFKKSVEIWPIDPKGIKRIWRVNPTGFEREYKAGNISVITKANRIEIVKKSYQPEGRKPKTLWKDPKHSATSHGTKLLMDILGENIFNYPKSLHLVKDCLRYYAHSEATILDFFAGSGTTGQAVLELNNEDDGNRKFILCTNNEINGLEKELKDKKLTIKEIQDYGICRRVTYPRLSKIIKGYSNSKGNTINGLSCNLKYYSAVFVKNTINKDQLKIDITKKCTEMLCLKEGIYNLFKEHTENEEPVWKIFKQNNHYLAVYYDFAGKPLESLKKEMNKISGDKVLYCFTTNTHGLDKHNFADWENIRLEPIPQKILDVYKRIFKGNDK